MKRSEEIVYKTPAQLQGCRLAGEKAAEVLRIVCEAVRPGVSTKELDDFAARTMRALGCTSADFGYCGYPAQTCISVNDAVIHGVPRADLVLKDGDLVSVDVTVAFNGFVGDNARTVIVGEGTPLRTEKGPDGLKVFLPPAYATAEIPFALKASR